MTPLVGNQSRGWSDSRIPALRLHVDGGEDAVEHHHNCARTGNALARPEPACGLLATRTGVHGTGGSMLRPRRRAGKWLSRPKRGRLSWWRTRRNTRKHGAAGMRRRRAWPAGHGGRGSGEYAVNTAREALPEGGRGRGDAGEAVGEMERGEARWRVRGSSMELSAAMATAAALVSPGVSDVSEREGATESKREGRRTRPL